MDHICRSGDLERGIGENFVQQVGLQGRTSERPQDRGEKDGEEDEAAAARRPVECLYDKQGEDLAQEWMC